MLKKTVFFSILSLACFPLRAADDKMAIQPSIMKTERDFLPIYSQNPQHQPLFNLAYGYLDFCHECKEALGSLDNHEPNHESVLQTNIEGAEIMVQDIIQLDVDCKALDKVLQEILYARLELIKNRANSLKETKEYFHKFKEPPKEYFIPTHPQKLILLPSEDMTLAKQAIDRYQFMNSIIYHLFKLVEDPKKLSRRTKEYLSCSRTLWPLLLDETTDLSYPDFAAITRKDDPQEYQSQKDSDYFYDNYELHYYQIIPRRWLSEEEGKKKPFIAHLSRSEIVDIDDDPKKYGKVLRLPRPSWLYNTAPQQEQINARDSLIQKEEISASGPLAQKKDKKGKSPQKVKAESFDPQRTESTTNVFQDLMRTSPEQAGPSFQVEDSHARKEAESPYALIEPEKLDAPVETSPEQAGPSSPLEDSSPREETKLQKTSCVPITPEKSKPKTQEPSDILPQPQHYLAPKGVRSRGKEDGREIGNPPLANFKLSRSHEKLIEAIFDYRQHGQGFNFGEFRSLWEHINGDRSVHSSGGSHRALYDKDGKFIGGTFAHGDSQTYTRKTVRYLRAALMDIGVDPK